MLFEVFVGQPTFDTFMITPTLLVGQMQEMASDDLPNRWHEIWDKMNGDNDELTDNPAPTLQEWLEELYFGSPQSLDLTREDIQERQQNKLWMTPGLMSKFY
ncbi:Protein kinase [Penicillium digitatum]|uniref:Protein kinase n=1 Tax=Penicillium digitatum TaxID=36651 RepID=A0A7T7BL33_PENDI|nr:Protein kinase [Penicillium digitatum]